MIKKFLFRSSPLFALQLAACEGCIDLDGYVIVPDAGSPSAGGAAGSSSTSCNPATEGRIFAVLPSEASAPGASGQCATPSGIGIDVFALTPRDGACEARARIVLSGSTRFEQRVQVRHSDGNALAVAGTFTGGELEFPLGCDTSSSVVLAAPPLGATSLYVARLRLEGSSFCTEWARRAWAENRADQLRVHAFEHTSDGSVIVGGALGGPPTEFEGSDPRRIVEGGAFVAHWSSGGALRSLNALGAARRSFEAVAAIAVSGASFSAAGFTELEDPACHSCTGVSHVTNAAGVCRKPPDAGMEAGDASTDEDANFDASDAESAAPELDAESDAPEPDATGMSDAALADSSSSDGPTVPVPDALNGFVLTPTAGGQCGRFESFGSDANGYGDLQGIFGISKHTANCGAYVAGLAGRNTWRLDGNDARTALATGVDPIFDGFIAHFSGGTVFGCADGGEPDFSVRLSSAGTVAGGPLVARRCAVGVAATALLSAPRGSLALQRCTTADGCDQASMVASLDAEASEQLVVMGLNGEGELDWHGAFGPVRDSATSLLSPNFRDPPLDLAADARDDLYVLITLDGSPVAHNVELGSCAGLSADPVPGSWIIKLGRDGFGDRARCRWARRLE